MVKHILKLVEKIDMRTKTIVTLFEQWEQLPRPNSEDHDASVNKFLKRFDGKNMNNLKSVTTMIRPASTDSYGAYVTSIMYFEKDR